MQPTPDEVVELEESLNEESQVDKSNRVELVQVKHQFELINIKKGMTVLELNGGLDHTTQALSEIVGSRGRVILQVPNSKRLEEAKNRFKHLKNLTYLQSEVFPLSLDDQTADLTYCRTIMEYFPEPQKLLEELIRVTKRGARIVCAELDSSGLTHYPMPAHLEKQLHSLVRQLQKEKAWDPFIGRKLFSMFHESCLTEVKTYLFAHHLVAGQTDPVDEDEWNMRFQKLEQLKAQGLLKLKFDLTAFKIELFTFFQNPLRLSFSPLIVVEGRRPE